MGMSLLEQVKTTCKRVSEQARYIHIREDLIEAYAGSLALEMHEKPQMNRQRHYFGTEAQTLAYFIILDSINFGSGYFPHLKKRPGMSGYFTIATSLMDRFRQEPMNTVELVSISTEECIQIFGQDAQNVQAAELMGLFAQALRDLGAFMQDHFNGDFGLLIKKAEHSVVGLLDNLIKMPFFKDVSEYQNREVCFFKRAQIMAADLHIAFEDQGPGEFHDLHRLTLFADNLVPHVLRMDGILEYDADLAARIDHQDLIPAGSPEEVEIRACAVHVVELLVAAMGGMRHGVNAMHIDNLLWHRGQGPFYKNAKPRHRTRSVFY